MTEQDGFIHSICEKPFDNHRRMVFADWLEEDAGQPERAEFIRLSIAETTLLYDLDDESRRARYPEIKSRLSFLVKEFSRTIKDSSAIFGIPVMRANRKCSLNFHPVSNNRANYETLISFACGFVYRIRCGREWWLKKSREWISIHPITHLTITDFSFGPYQRRFDENYDGLALINGIRKEIGLPPLPFITDLSLPDI
jgi:uncharacterized protein (TIGR02996 family)